MDENTTGQEAQGEAGESASVRVGFRLPRKTWDSMKLAAEPIGIQSTGGVVKWFALLGLQAAQASSATVRSANDTAALRALFERMKVEADNEKASSEGA